MNLSIIPNDTYLMKVSLTIFVFILGSLCSASAQSIAVIARDTQPAPYIRLKFQAQINNEPLELGKSYYVSGLEDSVSIKTLKFYMADLTFSDAEMALDERSYATFLIDMEDTVSLQRSFRTSKEASYNEFSFSLGIDSVTQNSGAKGGELDPTRGMYWSWQSGYINFKLEGTSNSCPARNHLFQYHIGGFQSPYNTLQSLVFEYDQSSSILIIMDCNKLLTQKNITENFQIMSPNERAMNFANKLPGIFRIGP